jgi:hypothetical protein
MESSVVLKTAFVTIVAIIVPALIFGCVRDVKTESATDFSLVSGQTWDWFPDKVKTWQQYKRGESMADLDKAELRALKREHKHIQKSIQRELSDRGVRRVEDRPPTYHVAYYLFPDGIPSRLATTRRTRDRRMIGKTRPKTCLSSTSSTQLVANFCGPDRVQATLAPSRMLEHARPQVDRKRRRSA